MTDSTITAEQTELSSGQLAELRALLPAVAIRRSSARERFFTFAPALLNAAERCTKAERQLRAMNDAAMVCDAGLDAIERLADEKLDAHPDSPLCDILSDTLTNSQQTRRERDAAQIAIADLEKRLAEAEHDYAEEHAIVERSIVFEEGQAARIAELERQLAETEAELEESIGETCKVHDNLLATQNKAADLERRLADTERYAAGFKADCTEQARRACDAEDERDAALAKLAEAKALLDLQANLRADLERQLAERTARAGDPDDSAAWWMRAAQKAEVELRERTAELSAVCTTAVVRLVQERNALLRSTDDIATVLKKVEAERDAARALLPHNVHDWTDK